MSLPNFASWNVRGFNNPVKVRMCKDLINSYNLKLLCILEAKIQTSMSSDPLFVHSHVLFDNERCCDNFGHASPGIIWIKWDANYLSFAPIFTSSQLIHGILTSGSLPPIFLSVVYAANSPEDRLSLWDNLLEISANITNPWVVMGDLNCCRFDFEKVGGTPIPPGRLGELPNFIFDSGLQDLASVGLFFTWFNQRGDMPIHSKLDRILVNTEFIDLFPTAYYKVDPPSGSDHSPLVMMAHLKNRTSSRFMFKNYWTKKDGFWEDLLYAFDRPNFASPIADFYNSLCDLKQAIRKRNWASSNHLSNAILEAKSLQQILLADIQRNPLDLDLNASLKSANDNLHSLLADWSSWISQRAKTYWLSHGEDDLGFLYAKIRSRKNRNNIKELSSQSGLLTSHQDIANALIDHFTAIFNAPSPAPEDTLLIPVGNKVPNHLFETLVAPISDPEIKTVVFAGVSSSAPGPDGFSFGFYQELGISLGLNFVRR